MSIRTTWIMALAACLVGAPGCKDDDPQPKTEAPARPAAIPAPLDNPAGFCRESCPLKVRCRLGKVADKIFEQEVRRCRTLCLSWIKTHAEEVAAQAPCYHRKQCSVLRGCLAEVQRIIADRKLPAKIKECTEMCFTFGTCKGDETDCRLRCQTGEVAIYRALIRCGTKRCPHIKDCIREVLRER